MLKKKLPIFRIVDKEQRKQLKPLGFKLEPREGGEWLVLRGWRHRWKVIYNDTGFMDSYELWRSGEYVGRVFTMGSFSSFVYDE